MQYGGNIVMNLSKKFMGISPSPTLSIDAKFKQMKADGLNVVGFGAGEPDFDTPSHIKQAAIDAIMSGMTKYTPASGILPLKKAVCDKLKKDNNLDYEPSQIVISNGAKHSLMNVFGAILNPGDEVIIPAPYWVSYSEMVKLNDGVPVIVYSGEDEDFKITPKKIEENITDKTKAIIINSPSNPTGMVYTEEELKNIADVCLKHGIYIVSDEIYEYLIYDDKKHFSIAQISDEIKDITIIVNGVSKTYAMTGWRIGYTASNPTIAKMMSNVQSHATSNPNSIAQYAALAALTGPTDELDKMISEFSKRRDYMCERIEKIDGVSSLKPNGAFYVMMNISKLYGKQINGKTINSADDFAEFFLESKLVAVVPGTGFSAKDYVRWSYATSLENIKEGLDRLESFLSELK